ncbi:serine-threonine rich [Fusarium austroafricanum]|uniref:Serine-threonine rich n=1 Tax=Fusarium austroafricanum TaxID=2364996 RepID=A0A8H4KLF8_9HYPO|nr:serine-threonine rich [Fusarium austroafricanum]
MKTSTSLALAAFAPMAFARFLERRDHPEPASVPMPAGHPMPVEVVQGGHKVVEAPKLPVELVQQPKVSKNHKTEIIIIWANPGAGAETTTINEKVTVTQTVTKGADAGATPPAAAASHTVTVGGPGGLVYQPEELHNVPIGDTVVFEFLSQNHTVSQSGFEKPCDLLTGGMDSGFMANPNNTVSPPPQVAMQVMVDTPLWFYCKQGNHCGQGMVFSINPTAEKTQAKFKELAIQQKGDGKATPITGGDAAPAPPAESKPAESKPAEAAPPAAAPPEATGVVPGKGVIGGDGSCVCHVSCAAGGFPAQAQGINSFGGMGGAMPYNLGSVA